MQKSGAYRLQSRTVLTSMPLSSHYSPFGSLIPNRSWSDASRTYRYGFNGKEKDFETSSDNYDFGARIYDGRLGRWLSLDPESGEYPSLTPYNGIGNSPIFYVDIDGNKIIIAYQEPKTDANGNFIVDPVTGNLQMETKYFEYKPGIKPPDNEFLKMTVEALDYISQSRAGRRCIKKAIKNPKNITIVEVDKYNMYMKTSHYEGTHSEPFEGTKNPDNESFTNRVDDDGNLVFANMIYWNPYEMTAIKDNNGNYTGKYQSAAITLGHELRHINKANRNPWRSLKLKNKRFSNNSRYFVYRDKEERRTIRWERKLIRQLNRLHFDEGKRYNWKGKGIYNKGKVTSTYGEKPKRTMMSE